LNALREHLRNGTGRRFFSWVFGLGAAALTWRYWPSELKRESEILATFQKCAFVTMAFAVTAYNLRTRVIDLLLKNSYKPDHVERLTETARKSGHRLTILVLLFTFTSVAMGIAPFLEFSALLARWTAAMTTWLLGYSFISFIYILFAFERLEQFVLDQAISDARNKEIDRLVPDQDNPVRENPSTAEKLA
jgi:hypothetical protein